MTTEILTRQLLKYYFERDRLSSQCEAMRLGIEANLKRIEVLNNNIDDIVKTRPELVTDEVKDADCTNITIETNNA